MFKKLSILIILMAIVSGCSSTINSVKDSNPNPTTYHSNKPVDEIAGCIVESWEDLSSFGVVSEHKIIKNGIRTVMGGGAAIHIMIVVDTTRVEGGSMSEVYESTCFGCNDYLKAIGNCQ
jgi:hypothetical protein